MLFPESKLSIQFSSYQKILNTTVKFPNTTLWLWTPTLPAHLQFFMLKLVRTNKNVNKWLKKLIFSVFHVHVVCALFLEPPLRNKCYNGLYALVHIWFTPRYWSDVFCPIVLYTNPSTAGCDSNLQSLTLLDVSNLNNGQKDTNKQPQHVWNIRCGIWYTSSICCHFCHCFVSNNKKLV